MSAAGARVAELPPGRIVAGKYAIQRVLARHAWGATYAALTEPNREVVVKLLPARDGADADATDADAPKSRGEGALARVPEHFVVRVIDRGVDRMTDAAFEVTPLSAAPSLGELVKVCPLTPREVVRMMTRLAAALDRAHAEGIVHGALKPGNVFVGPAPDLRVTVGDFGADAARRRRPEAERLACGAPWYAPEQADGDEAARASDVFAAGLLAFFALTGRSYWRAFERVEGASDTHAQAAIDAWRAELAGPPVAASERAAELGVTLPAAVDAVFARALARAPSERFTGVGELARALDAAVPAEEAPPTEPVNVADDATAPTAAPVLVPASATEPEAPPLAEADVAPIPDPPLPPAPSLLDEDELLDRLRPRLPVGVVIAIAGGAAAALGLILVVAILLSAHASRVATASSAVASPPPKPTTVPSIPPPPPASAATVAPTPTATAPTTTAAPATRPQATEILVTCAPACDRVLVDGKRGKAYPDAIRVKPGVHGIGVAKARYAGQWRRVVVKRGERMTVAFDLVPLRH